MSEVITPVIKEYMQDNPIPGVKNVENDVDRNCPDRDVVLSRIYACNRDVFDLKTKYIQLGGHLIDLKPYCKYIWSYKKGRTCKNIYEVAEHCFGFSKSTTANIIGVTERFGYLMTSLAPKFEKYGYSQLTEMLPLSDEQLELVNPDMTVQEIKALKKIQKKVVQTSGQNVENSETLINKGVGNFLSLKNDTERLDFLEMYKCWGVWLELPELNLKFYKCDLDNGDFIVVTENTYWLSQNDKHFDFYSRYLTSFVFRIIRKGTEPTHFGYSTYCSNDNEYLRYLKSTKAKPVTIRAYSNFSEYKKDMEV